MWKPGRTAGRHLRRHSRRNGRHVRHMFSQECASQSSYSVDRPKPAYLAFTVPPGYSRSGCSIPRKRAESGSSQAEAFCSGQSLPYRGQGFRLIPSADHSSYEWGAKSRSTVHQIFVRHPHYTQSQLFQGAKKSTAWYSNCHGDLQIQLQHSQSTYANQAAQSTAGEKDSRKRTLIREC